MLVYITNVPFLLIFALCVAQIIQIYGDDDGVENTKYDYEILKVAKYISSVEKRERSHSKGECTNRQYFEILYLDKFTRKNWFNMSTNKVIDYPL